MKLGHMLLMPVMLCTALLASCGDDDGDGTTTTTGTGTTTTTTTGVGGGGGGGGGEQATRVQLAHLSPDAPKVDFCARRSGGNFLGPVAKEVLSDPDAVAFGDVTGYALLPEGTYTIRFVAADATTCDTAIPEIPDTDNVSFGPEERATIAVIGLLAPAGGAQPLRVLKIQGEAEPEQGKARIRAFHAVPELGPVEVGKEENGTFEAIFSGVGFATLGNVGGKPYADVAPAMSATLSVREASAELLKLSGVDLAAGAVTTVYIAGNASGSPEPLVGIVCTDTPGQPDLEQLANCTQLQ